MTPESDSDVDLLIPQRLRTREPGMCARLRAHCWFLPVPFGNTSVRFLIDSGSEVTIVKSDFFFKEPSLKDRPLVNAGWEIVGIGGEDVPVKGATHIPITLGGREYLIEALVADINTTGVLGMNFFQKYSASSNFHSGELTLDGESFLMQRKEAPRSFQTKVAHAVTVPPYSESIVRTRVVGQRKDVQGLYCVQPAKRFAAATGLAMGGALVKPDSHGVPILVVNPTAEPIRLPGGTLAALCAPALSVKTLPKGGAGGPTVDGTEHSAFVSSVSGQEPDSAATGPVELPEHLEQLVPRERLSEPHQEAVRNLLAAYADVFAPPGGSLGRTNVTEHHIDLDDERPFRQRLRRSALVHQQVIETEVQKMLDADVIEPSDSPWASPVVMVKKKDGSWRFCVDYRKLNDITRKDSYPLPHIEDTFDALAGSHYFCALDLASGYWQVQMAEEDKQKTAFITKQGLYQFKVMPFGLCNAPATFERLMEMILKGYLWKRCMVYIDDVVVYGRSFQETLVNLQMVLDRLRAAGLKLKPSKCELFASEILYLGFMVSGEGVRPDPAKVACVENWPRPCTVSDVRSFLGFASYHRRFIRDFSAIARPLTAMTEKGVEFYWGELQEGSFRKLRLALSTAPMLSHPLPECEFILDTDASNFAVGGVLSQVVDGIERVVAYASTALSHSQMNYCTTHRELLAVVTMVRRFRHYLLGRNFRLRTDHSSLRWLLNYRDVDGMLARWLVKLQEYDMAIEHRPGRLHGNADGLSRCHKCKNPECPGTIQLPVASDDSDDGELQPPMVAAARMSVGRRPRSKRWGHGRRASTTPPPPKGTPLLDVDIPIPARKDSGRVGPSFRAWTQASALEDQLDSLQWMTKFSNRELAEKQRADSALKPLILAKERGVRPDKPSQFTLCEETRALAARWDQLKLRDGLLYRKKPFSGDRKSIWQLILPTALRSDVLHQLHDLRVTGHLGIQRTVARVQQRFYWPGCALDVARWCAACPQCAGRKGKHAPGRHPLTSVKAGAPFDRIALDILDTHNPTPRGYRYILVVSDYFTKWTDAFPMRRHTAQEVARLLVTRVIVYHGVPKQIHTDQGAEFEGNLFKSLALLLGSVKVRTSPYRPQSDGQVERFNRSVLNMLSAFVCDRANDWDDHLPYVLMAYRSSVHSSTGCTPFVMVHGQEQNLPVDLMYPTAAETGPAPMCGPEYVEWVRRAIAAAHNFARAHLEKSAVRQKRGYDAHAREQPGYKVGDKVRYYYPPLKQGNKFAKPWVGPFTVVLGIGWKIRIDNWLGQPTDYRLYSS